MAYPHMRSMAQEKKSDKQHNYEVWQPFNVTTTSHAESQKNIASMTNVNKYGYWQKWLCDGRLMMQL